MTTKYRTIVAMRHQPTVLIGMWSEYEEHEYARFMEGLFKYKTLDSLTIYEDGETPVVIHPDDISYIRVEKHK